ncbi:MAG TPA: type II toxin-antitoxin system VapC family toxin [Terriglobales bacterium]|nr:type II toxin-antitoxin system VapC family toxin [Terriglobales bacterium]
MILLDTHVLVWLSVRPEKLSRTAASAIRKARNSDGLAIADITLWELASLMIRGALRVFGTVDQTLEKLLNSTGVVIRPITPQIATLAAQFPHEYPHDPADRLIGATARAEGIALVTRDDRIRNSPLVKTIW